MQLFESMMANGVFIFPGKYFSCPEPGWFRIIFAMETDVLQIGKSLVESFSLEFCKQNQSDCLGQS